MSEANVPNPQGSQSTPSAFSQKKALARPIKRGSTADQLGEQPVNRLPLDASQIFDASALDEDAFEESQEEIQKATQKESQPDTNSMTDLMTDSMHPSLADNRSSIAAWSTGDKLAGEKLAGEKSAGEPPQGSTLQGDPPQPELPNLAALITLIQELNQCNSGLMDRVTQLEEALECSQSALQAEVGRTQDVQTAYNSQDWAAVQEQITTLFNQLEFAHQTNQRQQILIETLTGQLENSQERVAELEREAALLQQRHDDQIQLLQKAENTSRDLQARLQRQQRYTLQFKAALEKSLDMPSPQYEMVSVTPEVPIAPAETPFPKVPRIQPWSAQTHASAKASTWMKLQNVELSPVLEPSSSEPSSSEPSIPTEIPESISAQLSRLDDRPATSHLNLPSFGMPLLQVTDAAGDNPLAKELEQQVQQLTTDPELKQQLDAAVKPLADMLAEALLSDRLADGLANSPPVEPAVEPSAAFSATSDASSAEEVLSSVMADAEDALWQDLARLIDVSTEDVVKASLSGDIAAFESIDFGALVDSTTNMNEVEPVSQLGASSRPIEPPQAATMPTATHPSADPQKAETAANRVVVPPIIRRIAQVGSPEHQSVQEPVLRSAPSAAQPATQPAISSDLTDQEECIPALANSSWPSPIVYPLRPTKKRQSLAMVDLPTFPQG
jgi:hypothetical protein